MTPEEFAHDLDLRICRDIRAIGPSGWRKVVAEAFAEAIAEEREAGAGLKDLALRLLQSGQGA